MSIVRWNFGSHGEDECPWACTLTGPLCKVLVFITVTAKTKHTRLRCYTESQKPPPLGPTIRWTFQTNGKRLQFLKSPGMEMLSVWLVFPSRRPSDVTFTLLLLIFSCPVHYVFMGQAGRTQSRGSGRDAPQARSQVRKLINTHQRTLGQVNWWNRRLPPGQPVPTSVMSMSPFL